MAGQIDFSMEMDAGRATAGINSANAALNNMGRTLAGLVVPMNAVALAQGPTASFWLQGNQILPSLAAKIQGLTGHTVKQADALQILGAGTKSMTTSMRAMESVFMIFGSQVAPQMTTGVLTLTMGLNALKATAVATGISLSGIGVAALGVVGIVATLTAAVEYAQAAMAETQSGTNLVDTLVGNRDKLMEVIQKLYGQGKLGKEEAISLQVKLALAPNSADELGAAIKAVSARIREVQGPKVDLKALGSMQEITARVRADGLSGPARVTAELDIAVAEFTNKISDLGKAAGYGEKEINALINTFAGAKRTELEKAFLPSEEGQSGRSLPAPTGSALERIGFVMQNGRNGNDAGRETAINTRLMFTEQKLTNRLLQEKTPAASVLRE